MKLRSWLNRAAKASAKGWQQLWELDSKRVTSLLVAAFLLYYAWEGLGTTVIVEFNIPQDLSKELTGVDAKTLTHQLLAELASIRSAQATASTVNFNLVKGLPTLAQSQDRQMVALTAQVNSDYNGIIEKVGSLEAGPLKIPAAVLMRPFQRLIGQRLMQISLERIGSSYRLVATSDTGGMWQVTEGETRADERRSQGESGRLANLIQSLSYKIAFLDGIRYESEDILQGWHHFHQGVRRLVEYSEEGASASARRMDLLGKAIQEFRQAIDRNPSDDRSRYNLILAEMEESAYVLEDERKIALYQEALRELRELYQRSPHSQKKLTNLWIADYVLLGYTHFLLKNYVESIVSNQAALNLLERPSDLRAYVLHNIGVDYLNLDQKESAVAYFRRAILDNPQYARAYLNLGVALQEMDRFAAAEEAFLDASERDPHCLEAYQRLGGLYFRVYRSPQPLDPKAQRCLQKEAIVSLRQYLRIVEREGTTRRLVRQEEAELGYARAMLRQLEANGGDAADTMGSPPRGPCLEEPVKGASGAR